MCVPKTFVMVQYLCNTPGAKMAPYGIYKQSAHSRRQTGGCKANKIKTLDYQEGR